jgi:protein-tyrosine phosphatase
VIDLHAHILPGLDDGPRDMDATLALARAAVASGTRTLAATSHVDRTFWLMPEQLAGARRDAAPT